MPDHGPDAFASIFSDPSQPTIIGGQAVNLWAEFYSDRAKELSAFRPFVSKDGDLWADRRTVVAIRDRTDWKCHFYDEPRTHAVALLTKEIPGAEPLRIEVLKDVHGLTHADLAKSAIVRTRDAGDVRLLEPGPLLKGKIATLSTFKSKERPNDVRHIRLLLPIAREHFKDRLEAVTAAHVAERDAIAALRYVAEILSTPTAQALRTAHNFDFAAAFPAQLAASPLEKIRNFATKELPRILPHIGHNPIVRPVQPKGPNIRL